MVYFSHTKSAIIGYQQLFTSCSFWNVQALRFWNSTFWLYWCRVSRCDDAERFGRTIGYRKCLVYWKRQSWAKDKLVGCWSSYFVKLIIYFGRWLWILLEANTCTSLFFQLLYYLVHHKFDLAIVAVTCVNNYAEDVELLWFFSECNVRKYRLLHSRKAMMYSRLA